ncbi:hypothetical protein Lal_00043763 [Lupinus albus]|nr:hypothetical protein Lal_00043763 [Lupinus albus]
MEAQGTIQFMELRDKSTLLLLGNSMLILRYKDGKYWSMISGNLFELNNEIFMNVGGLSSSGYSIGDCSWVKENFDPTEVYKSFLRGPHLYIQGQLTKAGSLSIRTCFPTVSSSHALLTFCALTFPILSLLNITDKDHLVGEGLIHKMGIYKYGSTWQYQEDYTTIGLDLSDDDNQDGTDNQHATTQGSLLDQHLRTLLLASISWKLWSNGLTTVWIFTSKD